MPNYSLVSNAVFQPFSYQELLAPVMHQQQVQDQLAEQYEKLSSQADILEAMGANDRDSKAYRNFKNYSDNLRTEADNLYRNGLNSESRLRLSELKRRYNSEIVPIQNAWNKREEEAQMQMKASLSNPMIRFTRDASRTSLDQYLANPSGGYGVINLANIASQMGAMSQNLAKQLRDGVKVEGIDDFTKRHITQYGVDAAVINQWLKDPSKNPALTNMMNQVLATNGVTKDVIRNNPNLFAEATQAAQSGAWNAIGKEESQIVPDYYRRAMLDFDLKERAANNEYARKLQYETAKAQAAGASDLPQILSEGVSIETADGYNTANFDELQKLKGGKDALKAGYFGKVIGKVNPMAIYDEYKEELKKNQSIVGSGVYARKAEKPEDAKRKVLQKYAKYGVTDILSDNQYATLKAMGYSKDKNITSTRFSQLESKFNDLAKQRSRYSTNMASYDYADSQVKKRMANADASNQSLDAWEIKDNGKLGNPVTNYKDFKFKSSDNTKGTSVNDVLYDPQFKGKVVISLDNGKRYAINAEKLLGVELGRLIAQAEAEGAPASAITQAIATALNGYNKTKSKSDKDA